MTDPIELAENARGWHGDPDDSTQQRYWDGERWTRTRPIPATVERPAPPTPAGPTAGWYADPSQPQTQRYWDGAAWTEQRAPLGPIDDSGGSFTTVVAIGYILAVFLPFIGFIIGLTQINRSIHGILIVLLSTIVFFASVAFLF